MTDFTIAAINQAVTDMIKRNRDSICLELSAGIEDSMPAEERTAAMVSNCLSLSIKLSAQMILSILDDAGIHTIDERQVAKRHLKILSSDPEE